MANYNEQKIFSELGKLTPNELYIAYLKIKEFVAQTLQAEQKLVEEKANELQSKIDYLNNTNR